MLRLRGRRRLGHTLGSTERHDVGHEPGIRSQDTVVAVAMNTGGRDELREGHE